MITTLKEAEQALTPYIAVAGKTTGKGITVDRTIELSRAVGSPHERLKVVHVAGTSGKTSTSYFVSRLLASTGAFVGLTVSPHIDSITERVQLNSEPIADDLFCRYLEEFIKIVRASKQMPSYFEFMMVFALWVFDRQGVDYAVLETGLGGLHDASNVCRGEDKVCVITDIGFDHTEILGSTLSEIATQKAGIIAPGNHVLMHEQSDKVIDVIKGAIDQAHASLDILPAQDYKNFQQRNSRLACATVKHLAQRDNLELADDAELMLDNSVPGRMQVIRRGDTTIILDGAHNEQKTTALIRTLKNEYAGQRFAVIVAMKDTKDYKKVVKILSTIASRAIATGFEVSQDTPIRSVEPSLIQKEFITNGVDCILSSGVTQAIDEMVSSGSAFVLVTGSLYALGHHR